MAELSTPPGAFVALAGFLNHGGIAVPVLYLNRLLDLPDEPFQLHTPLVLVDTATGPLGLIVGSCPRVVAVPGSALMPLAHQHLADEAFSFDGRILPVLSMSRLVLEQESRRMEELREREQRRLSDVQGAAA